MQDKQGFMWFGTKDGLSKFDGYQFRNYRNNSEDKHSIGNNCIRSMAQGQDENIWIGTDRGVYIYNPHQDCFKHFNARTKNGVSITKEVNDIKQDQNGTFWFAVDWQGVFSYNPQTDELNLYTLDDVVNTWCIHIDSRNQVWIGTHDGGLNHFNTQTNKFERTLLTNDKNTNIYIKDIYSIYQYNYDNILIGTANNGVLKLNVTTNQTEPFLQNKEYTPFLTRDIVMKSENEMWIGTGDGVYIYNTFKGSIQACRNSQDPYSLSDNAVYSLFKDREGGTWVGTYFGGVNYYPHQYTPFNKYYPTQARKGTKSLSGKRIREFQLANDGCLWIGTEDGGLNLYNPKEDTFENFAPNSKTKSNLPSYNIHGLLLDNDKLWIGTYNDGLYIMDVKSKKITKRYSKDDGPNAICDNNIFSIYKDFSNKLWFGTIYGLCYYNPSTDNFTKITEIGDIFAHDILQTKDGNLWVGSLGSGLYKFNPTKNQWTNYKNSPEEHKSLSSDKVISLFVDSRNTLWISTEGGGICRYNKNSDDFTSFTTREGLPNNVIYKITEDKMSNLWLSTNQGIASLNLDDLSIKQYTQSDGLLSNQFNYKSGAKDIDGNIYFGGLEGFVSFNPKSFTTNKISPPVYITQFELFNNIIYSRDKNSPLKEAIEFTKEIHLNHTQSTFGFSFVALSYIAPQKNQYAYLLEGFDNDWIFTKNSQSAKYSNIPPGEYIFRVKATNNNDIWSNNEAAIKIIISPPYYKTIWAYLIYCILITCAILYFMILYKNSLNRKQKRRQEIFENEKSKEIYDAKIAFFTNIAHEIRTPLSLIKGPLDCIIKTDISTSERNEHLSVIDRNTTRLLDLTNQLLDFRKTEEKGFQLNFISTNIPQLINDLYLRFNPTATKQNLEFKMDLFSDNFYADVDKEALTKIISNLFSNAIKYTKSKIEVKMHADETHIYLEISSNGPKIKQNLAEKIFEPFFQINNSDSEQITAGTGLGLPLSRSLAELHGGKLIYLQSEDDTNNFQLSLPISQASSIIIKTDEFNEINDAKKEDKQDKGTLKYNVLIVEDDHELRKFISGQLQKHYNTYSAQNGQKAIELLNNTHIDLIISDVIMPLIDGIQLCEEIRSNVNFSHIPIILLTAKSNIKSKIEGLNVGADAYIDKPFSMDYVLAQTSNLLSSRNRLKKAFASQPSTKIKSIATTKADEDFLKKVTEVINSNMSNVQFNIDELAAVLNMSRSSLHRKIKGLSELTPNEFIILVKLKKAAEYLKEGYRVSEVYYIVGFSSSSYFSKVFKKQFGVSPMNWNQDSDDIS